MCYTKLFIWRVCHNNRVIIDREIDVLEFKENQVDIDLKNISHTRGASISLYTQGEGVSGSPGRKWGKGVGCGGGL